MSNITQRALAGGEIAPALWARTDQTKYATGLRTLRNFFIQRSGGVSNRAGFEFVGEVKDSTREVRLLRFQFNAEQTYVMEFGQGYIRWFRDGGRIVVDVPPAAWVTATSYRIADMVSSGGVYYYCTRDHTSATSTEPGVGTDWGGSWYAMTGTIYEIPSPYLADDLASLRISQSADVVTIVHPSYAPRELRRYDHARWTLSTVLFGATVGTVANLNATGGSTDTDDVIYHVTAISEDTGEEGLPAEKTVTLKKPDASGPIALTWDALAGVVEFRVYRSDDGGAAYGFIGTAGGSTSTQSDTTWVTSTSSVTETFRNVTSESTTQARNTLSSKATDNQYKVTGTINVSGTSGGGYIWGLARVYYKRPADAARVLGASSVPEFTYDSSTGTIPFSVTVEVPDDGYASLTLDVVAVVRIGAGTGSATATCQVDGTKIEWTARGTGFKDDGIEPDYSAAPPRERNVFASSTSYPAAVGSFQQRRLFGASTDQPERVWASKVGLPRNFLRTTPIADDDPVIFTLAGSEVNEVRHFLDMDGLFILSSERAWRVAGNDAGSITPSAINARQLTYAGASALPPLKVGRGAVFVEARGTVVRSLIADQVAGVDGSDLTIFASHLFDGYEILDWDYAQIPHSIIWAVRSDGTLLGLTYLKEQEIWGWHRHDTEGAFENVCVVSEGAENRLYAVVRRTVDGTERRYVERLASRFVSDIVDAVFLDSALSYDGRNVSDTTLTLTGGTDWTYDEDLTLTASADTFDIDDIGNEFVLYTDDDKLRLRVTGYTTVRIVTVRASKTVPGDFRGLETDTWARAVDTLADLDHLEGLDVAVLADGFVVSNPLDSTAPTITVTGGVVNLAAPAAVIHVGLPYISDLETLDLDTPQGPSVKDRRMLVNKVGLFVEASRGIFVGRKAPTGDDALEGLSEYPTRDALAPGGDDYDNPPSLITDYVDVVIDAEWNNNGRVLVRQVDPLPLSVLSVSPQGYLPVGG